jgi:hypothetical protein
MSKHGGAAYEIDVRARRPPFNVPQRECQLMCRACGPPPTPTQLHLRRSCGTLARERARAGGDAPLTRSFLPTLRTPSRRWTSRRPIRRPRRPPRAVAALRV